MRRAGAVLSLDEHQRRVGAPDVDDERVHVPDPVKAGNLAALAARVLRRDGLAAFNDDDAVAFVARVDENVGVDLGLVAVRGQIQRKRRDPAGVRGSGGNIRRIQRDLDGFAGRRVPDHYSLRRRRSGAESHTQRGRRNQRPPGIHHPGSLKM